MHEASMHDSNAFITLTYADEHLPYGGTLVKPHFQKFMKRLRERIAPTKIRFFMCGEYGDKLMRPHYHALIFGHDFGDKRIYKSDRGVDLFTSDLLEDTWGKGHATTGEVTWESAAYCARYALKKRTGKEADEHYERIVESTGEVIQIEPEYITMSLRPAIGRGWFDSYQADLYPSDFVSHKGKKYRVPAYYDKLLEAEQPDELQRLKRLRQENAQKWAHEQTKDRLRAREACAEARHSQLHRGLEQC